MTRRPFVTRLSLVLLVLAGTAPATAAAGGSMDSTVKDRTKIEQKYTWNLSDLYPTQQDWDKELQGIILDVDKLSECKGKLGQSAETLAGCLAERFDILKRFYKAHAYASRLFHLDLGNSEAQEVFSRVSKLGTKVEAAMSFVEPEILLIPKETLDGYKKLPAMKDYLRFLHDVTRRRAHIRNPEVEEVIAQTGNMASAVSQSYQSLSTVSVPYPEVELSDGRKVTVDQAGYSRLRALGNRADRLKVFQAFWHVWQTFKDTYANLLAGKVSVDNYYATTHGYAGDLEASLDATDVPTDLYRNMIKQVRAGLPTLWKYLDLRKEMLGLDQLAYHDLYTSIVPNASFEYGYEDGTGLILDALKPLGKDYGKVLKGAFDNRWVDVYPTKGKRTGAYSSGSAYGIHPFILLNYADDYNSMSTTAHEFGHAMHSYYANQTQPFAQADYPTFVAEVASTVNEVLLGLHLSNLEKDRNKRLFLMSQSLENFRTTVFRQALFAEFELRVHEMAQNGEALTADALNKLYLSLLREYYGEAEGHIVIDPLYAAEWSYVPHFYYNFYMFQYTTSFIAATSIAQAIFNGDTKARDNYLGMLKAGGSKSPVDLLKMAGVEMSGAGPYQDAFKLMNQTITDMKKLVGEK